MGVNFIGVAAPVLEKHDTAEETKAHEFRFKVKDHLLVVEVYDSKTGELKGTPIRFKLAGHRLAADFPGGLDGSWFITDSEGRITNG